MKILDEMWALLPAYQPQADAAGHGESWAKMCREKTVDAADAAAYGAYAVDAAAAAAATYAAAAAAAAAYECAQKAINRINKAMEKNT